MVESDFDAQSCGGSPVGDARTEIHAPVLRREPSFSRWCDEDVIERSRHSSEEASASAAVDDGEFELPLLHVEGRLNEGSDMEERNQGGMKYSHLSVENHFGKKMQFLGLTGEGGKWERKIGAVQTAQSHSSVATILRTLLYILVWYTFSTSLTLYNKTLLGEKLGKFPAPFLMNAIHFGMQAGVSRAVVRFLRLQSSIKMTWRDYFIKVVPTAVGTALDINLSNISLVFISVTFATMCKSASPIFLLLFAFAFKLEIPSIKLLGTIFIISVGILLTVAKETEFEFWGFIFVMLAAVMSGFRWSMTQILLQKETYGLQHPLTFMSYVTPVMALVTALLSFMMDPWHKFKGNDYFSNSHHILQTCLILLAGGALAFFMVVTEYILVATTSAVTVTIAGVVKEAITILVAVIYFHDQFTVLKGIGLVIIMLGVSLFNWYKYEKLQKGHLKGKDEIMFSTSTNGSAKYAIVDDMDDQEDVTVR